MSLDEADLRSFLLPLVARVLPGATIERVEALGPDSGADRASHKQIGYGAPLRIHLAPGSGPRSLVLHRATPNQFGHDRRADRAAELLLAYDTFGLIPGHTRALDVGSETRDHRLVSLGEAGEFYLLTTWAEGTPYADDLRAIGLRGRLESSDRARMKRLARYLGALHAERHESKVAWRRAVRDLFGSGEGIFGILDGYPAETPGAPAERLQEIENQALSYRARLRAREDRLVRIHGDFHPFNLVFAEGDDLSLLDASRGCLGEAADDVTALCVNFLFFALLSPPASRPAFLELWHGFFEEYLGARPDPELLNVAPPYLTWRALVLANPAWYPAFEPESRDRLLGFVSEALSRGRLDPDRAEELVA